MPTAATEAEVHTMLQNAAAVWRVVYNFANSASPNFRSKEASLFSSLKGEFGGNIYAPAQAIHGDLGEALRRAPAAIEGIARAYGTALGLAGSTLAQLWPQIYRHWEDNSYSVNSRELTFGDIDELTAATGQITCVAKASFTADTDYILFTLANGNTHAFWFDVTGSDTEPAGSVAADASTRVNISGATAAANVAAILEPLITAAGLDITADDSAGGGVIDLTVDTAGFDGNDIVLTEFVTNAGFLVTTFSGGHDGTNAVGDGAFHRLTVDRYANDIEACTAEIKKFECKADSGSGTQRYEEAFEVQGKPAEVFATLQDGSGVIARFNATSSRRSLTYLLNPSFDADAASASPTSISGWSVNSDIANYEIVEGSGNYFRVMPGMTASTSRGLKQTAADKVTQVIRVALDPSRPYQCAVWVKVVGADGNAILRVGSNSRTVALSGATWVKVALTDNENLWYDNFQEDTLDVELEWTGTTGYVIWDEVTFGPMDLVDGTWIWTPGGATAFKRGDILTCKDTEAVSNAIIQWFLRQAGLYLPGNKAGGETLADPSL